MKAIFAFAMMQEGNHRLRAMEPPDADRLFEWENRSEEWWMGATMGPWSLAGMKTFAAAHQDIWAAGQTRLMLMHHDETVGAFDLYEVNARNRTAGVGVVVAPEARQRGHGGVGMRLLHAYAFGHLGLEVLKAEVPSRHVASLKLFLSAGYVRCGELPKWIRKGAVREPVTLLALQGPATENSEA